MSMLIELLANIFIIVFRDHCDLRPRLVVQGAAAQHMVAAQDGHGPVATPSRHNPGQDRGGGVRCSTLIDSSPIAAKRLRRRSRTGSCARLSPARYPSPRRCSREWANQRAEVQKLYHAPDLTVLNVIWAPRMTIMPHNHRMWAVIGIYTGREDNIFWRRIPGDKGGKLEAAGAKALCAKDAEPLGHNVIHSVTNPIPRLTAAIHVYGGDFFGIERSEWNPESLEEGRYDVDKTMRMFEEANALYETA
jgi:predicted metal-dependent enzyme (double-stranded beta helix superfamily)